MTITAHTNAGLSGDDESLTRPRPLVLLLVDGWGVSQSRDNNAIRLAKIPNFKKLVSHYPAAILSVKDNKDSVNYNVIGRGLSRHLSELGYQQLKIAETEKLALVTNFFNGQAEQLPGEDYELIPSPVASSINMATPLLLRRLHKALKSGKYNFIVSSLANIDSLSRSGDFKTAIKAVEYVDRTLRKIADLVLEQNGILIVTSAHGYIEEVYDIQTEQVNKDNTDNPVPFIIVGSDYEGKTIGLSEAPANDLSLLKPAGSLEDIAPTILQIMKLEPPVGMAGRSLI
ncbi:MAG TPA: hypothetical protein PKI61_01685 [bacterium]|nr:hypothetical protein [bacterium]HPT30160.1 hypothetical protein [bacterium]